MCVCVGGGGKKKEGGEEIRALCVCQFTDSDLFLYDFKLMLIDSYTCE